MAVGVAEAQATITKRISLGLGTYLYIGTFAFGSEYATGGDTIASLSEGEGGRFKLPEKLEMLAVQAANGFLFGFDKPSGKVKAFWTGAAVKGVFEEVAAKTSLAALTQVPFFAIGD